MKTLIIMFIFLSLMLVVSTIVGKTFTHIVKFNKVKLHYVYGFIVLLATFWLTTTPLAFMHQSITEISYMASGSLLILIIASAIYCYYHQLLPTISWTYFRQQYWFLMLTFVVVLTIWLVLQINYFGININNNFSIDNEVYRNIVVDNYYGQEVYTINPRNGFIKLTEFAYLITSSLLLPAYLAKLFMVSPVAMWETYYPAWLILFMISLVYEALQFYVNKAFKVYTVAGILFLALFSWHVETFYNAEINKFFVEPAYPTSSTIFYPIMVTLILVQQIKNKNIFSLLIPTIVMAMAALAFHSVTLVCFILLLAIAIILYQITNWKEMSRKLAVSGMIFTVIVFISVCVGSYIMNGARALKLVPSASNFEYSLYLNYMHDFFVPVIIATIFIFNKLTKEQKIYFVVYPLLLILMLKIPGPREVIFNALLFGGRRLGDSVVTFSILLLFGVYMPVIIMRVWTYQHRKKILLLLFVVMTLLTSNRISSVVTGNFSVGLNRLNDANNTHPSYYQLLNILQTDAQQHHKEITIFAPRMMNIYEPGYKGNKVKAQSLYFQLSFLRSFDPTIKIYEQSYENSPVINIDEPDRPLYSQAGICLFYQNVSSAPWRTGVPELSQEDLIKQCHTPQFNADFTRLLNKYQINYIIVSKNDDTYDWYLNQLTLIGEIKDDKFKDVLRIYSINH